MAAHDIFEGLSDVDPRAVEWKGMPEFNQQDKSAFRQVLVSFEKQQDIDEFCTRLGIHLGPKTKSVWFPFKIRNSVSDLFYYDESLDVHPDAESYSQSDFEESEEE